MKVKTQSKKVNKAWLNDHVNDTYVKLAQKEGYRARAAYKLKEIDETLGLVRPGHLVVDLGSAPGAWSQYVRRRLSPGGAAAGTLNGTIIALDILPMEPVEGVLFLQGDFREPEVLGRLEDGNRRYMAGKLVHPRQDARRRAELATEQRPFAIVLGCSDSRTSPEVVFDQGLGDLFVVRVAGNVLNDHILGSIEYAVEHLGARVVVVLGHERCGAVKATKEMLAAKTEAPPHINSLVSAIRPAVESAPGADLESMIHANIRYVVQGLRSSAPSLRGKADAREIAVVGAYYDLDTGKVVFLSDSQAE